MCVVVTAVKGVNMLKQNILPRLLPSIQICRHLGGVNCITNSATRQGNYSPSSVESMHSSSSYDKFGQSRIKVYRAFERLRYMRLIKAAVEVGQPYPKQNPHLAALIEKIKKSDISVPIKQVIERTLFQDYKVKSGIFEIAACSGVLFILQYQCVDHSNTACYIKDVCQKYDFTVLERYTRRLRFYDQKGMLTTASHTSGSGMPVEEALEIAKRAGAESVSSKIGLEGEVQLEVFCNPSMLHQVKRELENNSFVIEEAFVGFVPKYLAKVPDSLKLKLADAIEDFSNLSETLKIYENIM